MVAFSLRKWAPASLVLTFGIYIGALLGSFAFSGLLANRLHNDEFMTWARWEPFPTDLGNLGLRFILTWTLGYWL
jgi:hypothetical protein